MLTRIGMSCEFDLEDRYAGREYVLYEHGIFRLYVGPPELAALADVIVDVAGIGEWIESD